MNVRQQKLHNKLQKEKSFTEYMNNTLYMRGGSLLTLSRKEDILTQIMIFKRKSLFQISVKRWESKDNKINHICGLARYCNHQELYDLVKDQLPKSVAYVSLDKFIVSNVFSKKELGCEV